MRTVIFCFSATGNSLSTARMLAARLGDCQLVGLASLKDREEIPVTADAVGFVFPVYFSDMPHLMRRVINRMTFTGSPYIFAVSTYKGHYGAVASRLDVLLRERGQRLSLHRTVQMPGNSRVSPPEMNEAFLAAQAEHVQQILPDLQALLAEDYATDTPPDPTPVHEPSNMRGLEAESSCVGCGTCERVCPMGNIRLQEGKPMIGDACISCLSCFHWCPQEAIWMSKGEEEMKRRFKYHHPQVTLADILALKTQ